MEKIVVLGDLGRIKAFQSRLGDHQSGITYSILESEKLPDFLNFDLVFDLNLDESPERLESYIHHRNIKVVGCAVKRSLSEMTAPFGNVACHVYGLNALPGFLDLKSWEVSSFHETDRDLLASSFSALGIGLEWVKDRVGMVTPRILCAIINEAFFTVQEGTATFEDIDQAMRLGTNYPGGPFEWAQKIGLTHILEILLRMKEDSGESRYKVAPLLKEYCLRKKLPLAQ